MKEKSTICIVDDDLSVRKALQRLLRSGSYATVVFPDAESYLANADKQQLDCLILDINMPGIAGTDLQKRLVRGGSQIPIIFLTGHGDIEMSVAAMKLGAIDFLTKPVDETALLDAVTAALKLGSTLVTNDCGVEAIRERLRSLTPRESEVLHCILSGAINKRIATHLEISEKTVKVHRGHIMEKLDVSSPVLLGYLCTRAGISPASMD
jgi:FixJ family two-component response regulator